MKTKKIYSTDATYQYEAGAEELIQHISRKVNGCQLLIGVPTSNGKAIEYLRQSGFERIESSVDTRLYALGPRKSLVYSLMLNIRIAGLEVHYSRKCLYACTMNLALCKKLCISLKKTMPKN